MNLTLQFSIRYPGSNEFARKTKSIRLKGSSTVITNTDN